MSIEVMKQMVDAQDSLEKARVDYALSDYPVISAKHEALKLRLEEAIHNVKVCNESLRQAIAEEEKQGPMQVTVKDFMKAVESKKAMVGRPVIWAQWPNGDTHPQPIQERT